MCLGYSILPATARNALQTATEVTSVQGMIDSISIIEFKKIDRSEF